MATDLEKILLKETLELIEDFNAKMQSMLISKRDLSTNSKAITTLNTVINEASLYTGLQGVDYFYYVVHGRGPGRMPPPYPNGEWPLSFPAAKKLAKEGNLAKMRPVADAFDKLFNELKAKIVKETGTLMVAYLLKNNTIDVHKEITIG
jgi:hypothetical protein